MSTAPILITVFKKDRGPLTKRISLKNGKVISDGSECRMAEGEAERVEASTAAELVELIESLGSEEALGLGALRADLPDDVVIATKKRADEINGKRRPDIIARTKANIVFTEGVAAWALLDYDTKDMPANVAAKIKALGGFWAAVCSVLPELADTERVRRSSTSGGLYRVRNGQRKDYPGSNGLHVYLKVRDGADIERFLKALHERCWLAGLGWLTVGAGGQILERSIIDRMVGSPERLVFEGPPIVESPLKQDETKRLPKAFKGVTLDTLAACPPLGVADRSRLDRLFTEAKHAIAPERARVRGEVAKELAHSARISLISAHQIIDRRSDRSVLLPDDPLIFDDPDIGECTVGDVLADPDRFVDETLADPLEGVEYGRCKAVIMVGDDGWPFIHSFAHGRAIYQLRHDAAAVRAVIEDTPPADAATVLAAVIKHAEVDDAERERLLSFVAQRSKLGKRTVSSVVRKSEKQQEEKRRAAAAELAKAEDPRPRLPVPNFDAEWLPVIEALNSILGKVASALPPMRNGKGMLVALRHEPAPNPFPDKNEERPRQWFLRALDEREAAELIERYVCFVDVADDGTERPVHLPIEFVRHFLKRPDDPALPLSTMISTVPVVMGDGSLLIGDGLDRERGIIFIIPPNVREAIPQPEECNDVAVREALTFLMDEWLCDVATDHEGKCVIIADVMTMIERLLLRDRPAFFITAGKRSTGKTTTADMIVCAVTGEVADRTPWSHSSEERRKALSSYLLMGLPYICWDNLRSGSRIFCEHIEAASTGEYFRDRKLGATEHIKTSAKTIHTFTGNNIGPKGDLASRSLIVRLNTDRPDPENREFRHPDPIGWTLRHRAEIMRALYTILLGNPMLKKPRDAQAVTRFKPWWRVVGSAIEHAAEISGKPIDFRQLFLAQEQDDEETSVLADMLKLLRGLWPPNEGKPKRFTAADVAAKINAGGLGMKLRECLMGNLPLDQKVTPLSIAKRLRAHVGAPAWSEDGKSVLILRVERTVSLRRTQRFYVTKRRR